MTNGSLLAIVAHPDDETLGCGGTLALHAEMGSKVKVLCLTCPSKERRNELKQASMSLGIEEPTVFDGERLSDEFEMVRKISDLIVASRPDIVVTHLAFDYHREHSTALRLVREAIEWGAHTTNYSDPWTVELLLQMEVNTLIPNPHIVVDVSEAFQRKMDALQCYPSQLAKFSEGYYQRFSKSKAELRGVQGGCRYGEAFIEEPL